MEQDQYLTLFQQYAVRMKEIRLLSTPDLNDIKDPDEFGRILAENFAKIGKLAIENRKIINDVLKPIMSSDVELTDSMRKMLQQFDELLVDAMAKKVKRDYFLISALTRYDSDELDEIRRQAIENRNKLAEYLDKESFTGLSTEAKVAALQFSLMGALLYESNLYAMPDSWWEDCLSILEQAAGILKDPFYRKQLPDYDWDSYEFRIYYYGSYLAYSFIPKHVAQKVYIYTDKAVGFLENTTNDAILAAVNVQQEKDLRYMASVLAGYTPAREACDRLYSAYEARDAEDYSLTGTDKNLDTPALYLSTAKMTNLQLTETDFDRYIEIQKSVLDYIYNIPKQSSVYMKCVTLLTNFPQ